MRLRLYDQPPAAAAAKFATGTLNVMFRHKNTSEGGAVAMKKWAASKSSHLHVQNLASTRSTTYSITDSVGFRNCVEWLAAARAEWCKLPEARRKQLDAITLDDLFDRRERETTSSLLWRAFGEAGWLAAEHAKLATGAYGHESFGSVSSPVIWQADEVAAWDQLIRITPPRRIWPWGPPAPGITTARGLWTPDLVRQRLETCKRAAVTTVLVWSGGAGAPVNWEAMAEIAQEFA